MNPLTNMKNVKKLSEADLKNRSNTSWHDQYRGSAWLFIGGLPYDLTEGDIICIFSQYGEPVNINLVRDKDTGKSKGFCFLCYEDQRSTDLAVDNLNGVKLLGRTLRVDHVDNYRPPKERMGDDEHTKVLKREGLAGISIHSIKQEEISTIKVEIKKEVTNKKPISVQQDSDFENALNKPKKKHKPKRSPHKSKKLKKVLSSDLDSSDEDSDSSDGKPKKRRTRKDSSTEIDSSSSSSLQDSRPGVIMRKSKKIKYCGSNEENLAISKRRSKTIEELKKEAKLIQEELLRRQKVKDEGDGFEVKKEDKRRRAIIEGKKYSPVRNQSGARRSSDQNDKQRCNERNRKWSDSPPRQVSRRSRSMERPKPSRYDDNRSKRRSRSPDRYMRRLRSPYLSRDKYRDRGAVRERSRERGRLRGQDRR